MVVFDLTDKESFNNVDSWLKEIEKHCGTDVSVIVLANKSDVGQKRPAGGNSEANKEEYYQEDEED